MSLKELIIEQEKRLLHAFENKDLAIIDELLHDDAQFVYPNGQQVTKSNVLDNYRRGNSAFNTIIASEQLITLIDDTAIVTMILELKGNYYDQQISSLFQYIRVWKLFGSDWRVIAVSGVQINTKQ